MTKANFLASLENNLKNLPQEEKNDALSYYIEYFEDSSEAEGDIINALGDPKKVAKQIMAEARIQDVEGMNDSPKKGFNAVGAIILAIFAVPIGLPILIALAAVVFALLTVVFAVVFSFFITAVVLVAVGVFASVTSFFMMTIHLASGIAYLGAGFIMLGIGILILMGTFYLNKLIVNGIVSAAKKLTRRNRNEVL